MAFHMLNVCVDMPDAAPDYVPEDLTVNDIETVVELVLEKALDIDNAIEEQDEADDTNALNFEMCKDFKFYNSPLKVNFRRTAVAYNKTETPYIAPSLKSFIKEIIPPPPKA
jgi:hypothetical protein